MDVKYGGRLPDWRYRAMSLSRPARGRDDEDLFAREAESRLAAAGLPWCFGELNYPHWRRIPVWPGDERSISYYAGDDVAARETALKRMILCSRCPVFDRCHKVTMAKKSPDPSLAAAERRADMLAALGMM